MKRDRFSHLARANRPEAKHATPLRDPRARPDLRPANDRAVAAPKTGNGLLRVFLDDERPCPPGWLAVRSPGEFATVVEEHGDRIECLALDWYLGPNLANGEAVAKGIARRLASDPRFLPALSVLTLHSSDRERAISMARTLEPAFADHRAADLPEVQCLVCDAHETASIADYLADGGA